MRAGSGPRPASARWPCSAAGQSPLDLPWGPSAPSPVSCPSPPPSCLPPQGLSGPPGSSSVDACGSPPSSGRSLGHRHLHASPAGAKGAERGFPQTASSSQWREFGLGEQATPWPPCPGGWAACSASGPGSSLALGTPGPLHFALRGGRLPWGPTLTSSGQKGRVSPAEGVQQGQCPPCSSPAIFRCLARRLPEVKGPREVSAGRRGEEPCLPSATSFLS